MHSEVAIIGQLKCYDCYTCPILSNLSIRKYSFLLCRLSHYVHHKLLWLVMECHLANGFSLQILHHHIQMENIF